MTKDQEDQLKTLLAIKQVEDDKTNTKPTRGLTDKISIAVATFVVAAFVFSAMLMWKTGDTSGLAYFIPSVAGFGTIVLTAIVKKNTIEKELQYGNYNNEEEY